MDKQKIIDKIKKCLALSKSSNANEAATALRQAQKMMDAHGLSDLDIELGSYSDDAVDVPIQKNKKTPLVLQMLLHVIKKAFNVRCVIEDRIGISDVSYRIRYFGPTHRVTMAAYAHEVVYRAMENAWKEFLKEYPHVRGQRGARSSFQVGWLEEVAVKVEAIGFPEEELAATQALMDRHYGRELQKSKVSKMGLYGQIRGEGRSAAKDFSLHRPMDASKARLGKF